MAFTLVELLVVITIVAIVASLVLPSLARAKAQARRAQCQNNSRQLILACLMYCDDNKGFFPYNMGGPAVHTNLNWVSDIMDWDTNSDNTNLAPLTTEAALGPFVAESAAVFRCPSDWVLSSIQQRSGWPSRVRSYSMNASVGDAGDISRGGVNTNNPGYIQFFKTTSLPTASQIFVFMEEHPDTISDGYFLNDAYPKQWIRLPASYHEASANISFADRHAELHRWRDYMTTPPSAPDAAAPVLYTNLPASQQDDFVWVISHMSVKAG